MKRASTWALIYTLAVSAHAAPASYCELNTTPLKKRVKLANDPNYFISADPSGKYTAVIDEARENILVNMETGAVHDVPGDVDPVFSPDSKFLTLPGGEFYAMDDIESRIRSNRSARNVGSAINANEGGVYQSIGILPGSTDRKKTYRYMDDSGGASYFDVEVNFDSNGKMRDSRRINRSQRMCREASARDTPMMSKDGKYLSILNFETHTTQIWRVNDNGTCEMMVDIGVPTGKVDFGFDEENPQITFHVDEVSNDWHYFSGVDGYQRKSVYVMNLNKEGEGDKEKWSVESMAKVVPPGTTEMGTGSYYPRFRKDGSVVMVSNDADDKYYLDVVATSDLNFEPLNPEISSGRILEATTCSPDDRNAFASQLALGWLWADVCSNYEDQLRASETMLIPLGMERKKCEELVSKKWEESKQRFNSARPIPQANYGQAPWQDPRTIDRSEIIGLSVQDLLAACPDSKENSNNGVEVIDTGEGHQGPLPVEKIVSRNCIGCHETGVQVTEHGIERNASNGPFIDFSNITPEDATAWIQRIFNPRPLSSAMPPPKDLDGDGDISVEEFQKSLKSTFSEEELKTLREKLNAIEQGNHDWQWRGR